MNSNQDVQVQEEEKRTDKSERLPILRFILRHGQKTTHLGSGYKFIFPLFLLIDGAFTDIAHQEPSDSTCSALRQIETFQGSNRENEIEFAHDC